MLNKEFSVTAALHPYIREDVMVIWKMDCVPTNMNRAMAHMSEKVHCIRPGLKHPVNFYGVTHVKGDSRMVTISDGHCTSYYWFSGDVRARYKVKSGSSNFEGAWEALFKALLLDDTPKALEFYDHVKAFFMGYFQTPEGRDFNTVLSGKWKGLFVHLEFERTVALDPALLFMRIHDKEMLVNLNTHPLVEVLG